MDLSFPSLTFGVSCRVSFLEYEIVVASLRSAGKAATNDFKCIKISSVTAAKTTSRATKPRTKDEKKMGKGPGVGCK